MTSIQPPTRRTNIPELIAELEECSQHELCSLAFDGDGTLWSGDVSDDVFHATCRTNWVLDVPIPKLTQLAREHGISTQGTGGELLGRFFEAEKSGQLQERLLFEVMTWCYAGRSVEELSEFAARALTAAGIESRIRTTIRPLLDWARARGHDCWLVTASPWPIVRAVARRLGFEDHRIIASRTREPTAGVIGTEMLDPVPYDEQKVIQLRAQATHARLLAAFGDSYFDLALLGAAELAVAVSPKSRLASHLHTLQRAALLVL